MNVRTTFGITSRIKVIALIALAALLAGCGQTLVLPTADPSPVPPTATAAVLPPEATATEEMPTADPEPRPTDMPTLEPTPTETLVPTPEDPVLTLRTTANCRGGPGVPYAIELSVRGGSVLPIVGQSQAFGPLWWKVNTAGTSCWIWGGLGTASGGIETVPNLPAPPTPTPSPTPVITPTATALGVQFPVTFVNNSGTNVCFLFIVPSNAVGWGKSVLPGNLYLPPDSKITFLLSGGKYNFRAEDCKDDVIEIAVDQSVGAAVEWVIGP